MDLIQCLDNVQICLQQNGFTIPTYIQGVLTVPSSDITFHEALLFDTEAMHQAVKVGNCTLNSSSVALSPVIFAALISNSSSSATFLSPKMIRAVTMMIIPPLLKSSSIQNVKVFPEPVGEIVTQSFCSSCAMAAQAWKIHGWILNFS